MIEPNTQAKTILESINYATIATVDENGQPWNTPVAAFRFDGDYTIYWASWTDNQHSKNIRANGRVFIVVYDSTPTSGKPTAGVYMQADASELTDEREVMKAALVFKNDPYNPSDGKEYLEGKPRRVYMAVPQSIWTNDDSELDGNFIDIRKKAEA